MVYIMGADQRIVRCARVSFAKDDQIDVKRDKGLLRYLYEHRHSSPFEHVIIAYEAEKEEWLNLISLCENPTFQVYYSGGYIWINLRNAINALEFLPAKVVDRIRERLPTTYAVINGQSLEKVEYTRDYAYVKERVETSSGWIGLVDSLELGTSMDYYTFVVECPLFVARQWQRHRFGSYNEVSRRYVSYKPQFYIPPYIRKQAKTNKQASQDEPVEDSDLLLQKINNLIQKATELYEEILEDEGAKELARGVLPQFMLTRFYWTVPRISLDNFITLRTHEGAQKEIREFAQALKEMVGYRGTDKFRL